MYISPFGKTKTTTPLSIPQMVDVLSQNLEPTAEIPVWPFSHPTTSRIYYGSVTQEGFWILQKPSWASRNSPPKILATFEKANKGTIVHLHVDSQPKVALAFWFIIPILLFSVIPLLTGGDAWLGLPLAFLASVCYLGIYLYECLWLGRRTANWLAENLKLAET